MSGCEKINKKNLKSKIKGVLIMFCFSISIPSCFADIFSLDEEDVTEYGRNYNAFPSVEDADDSLKGKAFFGDFLAKAGEIVLSYGFEKHTGLRLIHRHFDLEPSRVMVEEFQDEDGPSLVTSSLPIAEARLKGAVPSGWVFGSSATTVFEFSTDEGVRSGLREIQSTPEFLEQMEKAMKDFGFENLMSVSLLRKDSLFATEGQYYQEITLPSNSVVQIVEGDWRESEGVRTSWSFRGPKTLKCEYICYRDASGHRRMSNHRPGWSTGVKAYGSL